MAIQRPPKHGEGQIITGHVLDVNKKHLERAMKAYDDQLYFKWNPEKREGFGMWEVRRRPNTKVPVYCGQLEGKKYYKLEYQEHEQINHIMYVEFLNYNIITKLKSIDTWVNPEWLEKLDQSAEDYIDKAYKERKDFIRYSIKQDKKYAAGFREAVRSGYNPLWFLNNK